MPFEEFAHQTTRQTKYRPCPQSPVPVVTALTLRHSLLAKSFYNGVVCFTRTERGCCPSLRRCRKTMMPASKSSVFVYGTLMAPQVLKVLIGRVPEMLGPAILSNYRRHPVKEQVFPGMIPCSDGSSTAGLLLQNLSEDEIKVLDWFEGDEYVRRDVKVWCDVSTHNTMSYIWSNPVAELDLAHEWDYQDFLDNKLSWYLKTTVEPCRLQFDELEIPKHQT